LGASNAEEPALAPPRDLTVPPLAFDESSITLVWSKPADYSRVASYDVYRDGALAGETTKLHFTFTGLEPGAEYALCVRSRSADGAGSPPSDTVKRRTATPPAVIDVTSLGAVGDGATLNTLAIQKAIDACPPGGKVLIPAGTFKSGALDLKSDMTLEVDGRLEGSDDPADYPYANNRFPAYRGCYPDNHKSLLNAYAREGGLRDIRITGSGTISGGTWDPSETNTVLGKAQIAARGDSSRSDLVNVRGVTNLYIGRMGGAAPLKLVSPPAHTIFIAASSSVTIHGIDVRTYDIHNGDGVDLGTSDDGYIFDSTFDTGDDCVNLGAGVGRCGVDEERALENVRVFNCVMARGHGGVALGSYTAAWIKNVLVEDCAFDGTDRGIRLKTAAGHGGGVDGLIVRDVAMTNIVKDALLLDSHYRPTAYPAAPAPGVFRNVTFTNISATGTRKHAIYARGLACAPHGPLGFRNVAIEAAKGALLEHIVDGTFDTVRLTGALKAPWKVVDSARLAFKSCSPPPEG
jgi:exo-poly-alpha-galacturonosidase